MSKISFLIRANTLEEEVDYVFGLMKRMGRFKKFGYNLSLPDTDQMNELIERAPGSVLGQEEREIIFRELEKVYDKEAYEEYVKSVQAIAGGIDEGFKLFQNFGWNWEFKSFPEYNIRITQFGPGGSYCNNSGKIVMKWSKCIQEPLKVILHEMFHIGIENSIIQKFGVQHDVKERIVDSFLEHNMKKLIPDHKMQKIGNRMVDPYLVEEDSWRNLHKYIKEFVKDNKKN